MILCVLVNNLFSIYSYILLYIFVSLQRIFLQTSQSLIKKDILMKNKSKSVDKSQEMEQSSKEVKIGTDKRETVVEKKVLIKSIILIEKQQV